jgi:Septum formation initiator
VPARNTPARTTEDAGRRRPSRSKRAGRRRLRILWLAGVLALSVYLYYRPLASYFETRSDLASAREEVVVLRDTRDQLEERLQVSTSLVATRREARRIGYVRPGEQLFVVKGIPDWRKARNRNAGSDANS